MPPDYGPAVVLVPNTVTIPAIRAPTPQIGPTLSRTGARSYPGQQDTLHRLLDRMAHVSTDPVATPLHPPHRDHGVSPNLKPPAWLQCSVNHSLNDRPCGP